MGNETSRPSSHSADEPWAFFPGEAPIPAWKESHAEHDIFPTDVFGGEPAAPAKEGPEREASMMIQKHIRRKSSQRVANYETVRRANRSLHE